MLNKYEFRRWNTYEEWYEVEAKDEKEAWEKFYELGEDDITTSKFCSSDGTPELYRTTVIEEDELAKGEELGAEEIRTK